MVFGNGSCCLRPPRRREGGEVLKRPNSRADRVAEKSRPALDEADQSADGSRVLLSAEALSGPGARRPAPAETLFAVARAVTSRLSLTDVLRQTTSELARALGADVGSFWRLDAEDVQLLPVAGPDTPKHLEPSLVYPQILATHALAATVRETGGPVYSSDSARDPRFAQPPLNRVAHRSVLVQPLKVKGEVASVFVFIWTRARHRFTQVQLRLVEAVTQHAGMAIEHAQLLAQVHEYGEQLDRRVRDRTSRLRRTSEELRASREALRALSTHAEHVRERERSRIAREIHDELGQALTGLKLDLCRLAKSSERSIDAIQIGNLPGVVDAMIETVRRIAGELRPQVLDDLGLIAALEWQTRDFTKRSGVQCRLRCLGPVAGIDLDRSTALFRIFQEILTNVARHAHASRVQITLTIAGAYATLQVRDNGCGMSEGHGARPPHLGLLGMQERAAEFGGGLHVTSAPGKGTTVRVRLPLERRGRRQERAS
jgi:signal transduction histidine kinase